MKFNNKKITLKFISLLMLGAFSLSVSNDSNAANTPHEIVPIEHNMKVDVGKSQILKFDDAPIRVAISNPGILYLLQVSPKEWEIIGRNVGTTNLYVWTDNDTVHGSEVSVGLAPPPYLSSGNTLELLNGNTSELIYLGHPSEKLGGTASANTAGLVTDMPEPCLVPGCI